MRRYMLIILLLILCIFSLGASIPVADDSMYVEFASEGKNIFGFSKKDVTTLQAVPQTDIIDASDPSEAYEMTPDISKSVYTTGPFHFYAQLFARNPITITFRCKGPLSKDGSQTDTIHYNNVGRDSSAFTGSASATQVITLLKEASPSDYPRVYAYDFEFQVPFSSITSDKSGTYTSSITIEITSEEGGGTV